MSTFRLLPAHLEMCLSKKECQLSRTLTIHVCTHEFHVYKQRIESQIQILAKGEATIIEALSYKVTFYQ